mmetsp:Transcript_44934/g.121047  ORF Transcript_44934/g.121047 Transcript_44934/m.121047 type:complete len:223 (-) Transcript_44934:155-823(-)
MSMARAPRPTTSSSRGSQSSCGPWSPPSRRPRSMPWTSRCARLWRRQSTFFKLRPPCARTHKRRTEMRLRQSAWCNRRRGRSNARRQQQRRSALGRGAGCQGTRPGECPFPPRPQSQRSRKRWSCTWARMTDTKPQSMIPSLAWRRGTLTRTFPPSYSPCRCWARDRAWAWGRCRVHWNPPARGCLRSSCQSQSRESPPELPLRRLRLASSRGTTRRGHAGS